MWWWEGGWKVNHLTLFFQPFRGRQHAKQKGRTPRANRIKQSLRQGMKGTVPPHTHKGKVTCVPAEFVVCAVSKVCSPCVCVHALRLVLGLFVVPCPSFVCPRCAHCVADASRVLCPRLSVPRCPWSVNARPFFRAQSKKGRERSKTKTARRAKTTTTNEGCHLLSHPVKVPGL